MADIFLSYRRQDSQSATGRLADRLEAHFGPQRVFRDQDSIAAGDDFAAAIHRGIATATVLLVMVGPDWVDARSAGGTRRLADPRDFVRLEIETALAQGVAIVPVLVEGARMPAADALPPSLAAFARCQAVELSETRWHHDVDQLIGLLQDRFGIEASGALRGAAPVDAIGRVARFGVDLLALALHPRRLVARRLTGHVLDAQRAFLFLLLCLLAGNLALLAGFGGPPTPRRDGGVLEAITWVGVGVLVGVLAAALLAALLALAWRVSGVRAGFGKLATVVAYLYSGVWLGFCLGALVLTTGILLGDATLFDRMFERLYAPGPDGVVDVTAQQRWQDVEAMVDRAFGARGALAVSLLGIAIWTATAGWLVVAWGAFRQTFGVGRGRAALATAVFVALLAGLVRLAGWLG